MTQGSFGVRWNYFSHCHEIPQPFSNCFSCKPWIYIWTVQVVKKAWENKQAH